MSDIWYKRHAAKALNGMKFLGPDQYTVYNRLIDILYDEAGLHAFNPSHFASINLISTARFNKAFWYLIDIGKGDFVVFVSSSMVIIESKEQFDDLQKKQKGGCFLIAGTVFKKINGRFLSKKAQKYRDLIFPELNKNNGLPPPKKGRTIEGKNTTSTGDDDIGNEEGQEKDAKTLPEWKVILDKCIDAGSDRLDPTRVPFMTFVDIRRWMEADPPCDLEQDILPAIDLGNRRTKPAQIKSWKYYEPIVLEFRDRRLQGVAAPKERTKNERTSNTSGKPTKADHDNARRARRAKLLERRKADGLA